MMSRISTEAMSSAPAAEEEDVLLNGHLATGLDYDRWWIVFRKIDLYVVFFCFGFKANVGSQVARQPRQQEGDAQSHQAWPRPDQGRD